MRHSLSRRGRLWSLSSLLLLVAPFGCASVTSGVKWHPHADAPALENRGDGCYVEVYELGNAPTRPHQVVGTLELSLDAQELSSGGGQGVAERFQKAACEYGVFLVTDIKAFPDTTRGGASFEAKGAVYLDEQGRPILVRSGKDGTGGDAAEAAAEPTEAASAEPSDDAAPQGAAEPAAP